MRPLVILRPEPGASATAGRAAALGLEVRLHPLFRTVAVPWTMPTGEFYGLLLTSANAVRHAGALPVLPVYAVGEATAVVARKAGATVAATGTGGVDALLASLPEGLRLLHLAGAERIAPVDPAQVISVVTVYRTEPLPPPIPDSLAGTVLLVHSPAAGRRVADLSLERAQVRIAAISEAAARACGVGWAACEAAPRPSDDALLPLAAKLCKD
ncbi:uroporphyrinogen-III synthase [Sphingomonas astaxanthinifaciens]|uniref:Uroporphyrinogen III methyltransferase n=1 Tax=Sphingomonas astaxanthinifaciens DSM 22298 TaxID=1123267 RepID=A0ABQ5Z1S4_9SPHN|nr:uroporphyrinogen-III synthase [Sphingomonas astaxanthinifaciens]GLR46720.1 uroporphyrinogen III methyltransferase [Sphingomonas astaxanthinifaciens DSM 22298]